MQWRRIQTDSPSIRTKRNNFRAYHDNFGHQGRDRKTSLIEQRFFWPRMTKFIKKGFKNVVHV